MEIGVGPGIRIYLNADNEPRCRGASNKDALSHAYTKLVKMEHEEGQDEQCDIIRQWIKAVYTEIAGENLEARVDKEYKKEYERFEKHGEKLPVVVRERVKEDNRQKIRDKLK